MEMISLILWTIVKAYIGYVLTYKKLETPFKIYLIVFGILFNIPVVLMGIAFIPLFGLGFLMIGLGVIDYFVIKWGGETGRKNLREGKNLWPFGVKFNLRFGKERSYERSFSFYELVGLHGNLSGKGCGYSYTLVHGVNQIF